jgi:hypothetical protein
MIAEAERQLPVRIRIGVPPHGLGSWLDSIKEWAGREVRRKRLGDPQHRHTRRAE